jgi:DNA (cytosine-5)-methyltransferase 3A
MNVLDLFAGMEGGAQSLHNAGVSVNNHYSSEFEKNCQKVISKNWPDIIQLGDVTKWREWDIDWSSLDLLIAGSPCQGFSYAGKQLAFDDSRSVLFFVFADILNHIKSVNQSVKFMLENVKMKSEHMDVITEYVGVEPFFHDAKHSSPCSRPRNYWANFPLDTPDDSDICFTDCMDMSSAENTMSDGWHKWWEKNGEFQTKKKYSWVNREGDKGITMTARQYASWNGNYVETPNGKLRKPTKNELCRLAGFPDDYLDCVSQRQAELMVGNGWDIRTTTHFFRELS